MELIVGIGKPNTEFSSICTLCFWGSSGDGFVCSTHKVPNCIANELRIGFLCSFSFFNGVVSDYAVIDYEDDIEKAISLLYEYAPMEYFFG